MPELTLESLDGPVRAFFESLPADEETLLLSEGRPLFHISPVEEDRRPSKGLSGNDARVVETTPSDEA